MTSPQFDVHVQFLQDILLQYMCSKTVPTENLIKMKTKEIHFSLFYFHFNYFVDHNYAKALARDKQYSHCILTVSEALYNLSILGPFQVFSH